MYLSSLRQLCLLPSLVTYLFLFSHVSASDSRYGMRSESDLAAALKTCLSQTQATILYADDGNTTLTPQNTNYDYKPAVVVQPTDVKQIQATIQCVLQQGGNTKLSTSGGGHSYAAYELGGTDGFVVIDSSQMQGVSVDVASKTATVQMGALVGKMATTIGEKGFALPHGTCGSVGMMGHALGGGWGFTSRPYGWLTDHITSITFVDAKAEIRTVDSGSTGQDKDIWWAMRGAGANNFGVVAEMTFALVDAPAKSLNWKNILNTNDECAQALLTVQELAQNGSLPTPLGLQLLLYGENSGNPGACSLAGQYMGSEADFRTIEQRILGGLKSRGVDLKPGNVTEFSNDWVGTLTNLMGDLSAPPTKVPYYSQSLMDDGTPGYTQDSANAILTAVNATVGVVENATLSLSFDLDGPGSATNAQQPYGDSVLATAGKRNALFLSQIYVYGAPAPGSPEAGKLDPKVDAVTQAVKDAKPDGQWGSYVNYIDPRLANWGVQYYGDALGRLKALKAEVDPTTMFDYPQGLAHA